MNERSRDAIVRRGLQSSGQLLGRTVPAALVADKAPMGGKVL